MKNYIQQSPAHQREEKTRDNRIGPQCSPVLGDDSREHDHAHDGRQAGFQTQEQEWIAA